MRPTQLAETIDLSIKVKQPLFIWGEPGIGKSSIVRQRAEALGYQLTDLRLSLLDSVDLRGFPYLNDGQMHFASPVFLPKDSDAPTVLFLDEMNAGNPSVQAAAYQLILDRRIGEYKLPDSTVVIAAGNRESDQGVTYTMAAPLAARFSHADLEVHFDDWRGWALNNAIRPEIINFINFRPGLLHDFDPDQRVSPTQRGWEFVNRILSAGADTAVERGMIAGTVGDGACAEFVSFLKIYRNLPNPDAILMNPNTSPVPDDLATLYALCGALANRASDSNFDRLVEYCSRLREEFQVLCIRDSIQRNKDLANTKAFSDWAVKNSSVLV